MATNNDGPYKIGEIDFKDISVPVYSDKYAKEDSANCVWQMRNPNTCYTGVVYMNNETGKITYPDDAVIPEQTDRDREMLPRFMIVKATEITDALKEIALKYMETEYKRRNGTK